MINEHTPNSALIAAIALDAVRPDHGPTMLQIGKEACAEYDRRFPRATLRAEGAYVPAWYESLKPGDRLAGGLEQRAGTFVSYDKRRPCLWWRADDESLDTWARPDYFRPLPTAAPWYESLKPGDRFQSSRDETAWIDREFVSYEMCGGARVGLRYRISGGESWVFVEDCRPLPPAAPVKDTVLEAVKDIKDTAAPAVDDVAEEYAAYREASVATGVRFRETLAAKDAEIAKLTDRADSQWRRAEACESLLRAERATVSRLTDEVRSLNGPGTAYSASRGELRDIVRDVLSGLGLTPKGSYANSHKVIVETITKLRASALVVPEEMLKGHPLPWREGEEAEITCANGRRIGWIDCFRTTNEEDRELASAIVKAANSAVKS